MSTKIIEIKPFIKHLQKASMDCHKSDDSVTYGIPLGQLVEIAMKYSIETCEGWKEKPDDTINALFSIIEKIRSEL